MISKDNLSQLIKDSLSNEGLSIVDSALQAHVDNMLPALTEIISYPAWDVKEDILAQIATMILQINSSTSFKERLKPMLIKELKQSLSEHRPCWFVGASWGDGNDQTQRFLDNGIWENGYDDKFISLVKSVKVGDRIAIKAAGTRKNHLPFKNNGHTASEMSIKATGIVTKNIKDGKSLEVAWTKKYETFRKWYFYTNRTTIWKVEAGDWKTDALIDFTFNEGNQDYSKFANAPFWRERFGDTPEEDVRFKWANFYEEVANSLSAYRYERAKLTSFILELADKYQLSYIQGKELEDIDPFTVMGVFNRGMTDDNRKKLAAEIAAFLNVKVSPPESFEAIPILNNQKSWFFWGKRQRGDNDIDNLWALFDIAKQFADSGNEDDEEFLALYNKVASQKGIRWNLTMGLYWIRPWFFPTLESQSQEYLASLSIKPELNGPKKSCTANDYLLLRENLLLRFAEDAFPVHSFPELSLHAWQKPTQKKVGKALTWKSAIMSRVKDLCLTKDAADFTRNEFQEAYVTELVDLFPDNSAIESTIDRHMQLLRNDGDIEFVSSGHYEWLGFDDGDTEAEPEVVAEVVAEEYSIESIIKDGCFLPKSTLNNMLSRLKNKKNIILQGPPGTGKTWLGKRLAYALIGEKQPAYIKAVQFHPNLSYEDFIKGWRPSGDGKLELCDGPFLEFVKLAQQNPAQKYVVVIEEINRGNPAQIFGEMLTLLEADKRTPSEALELSYRKEGDEPVYIPENLYVVGTMNVADRSLALVDLALRRRFAFINLEPTFGKPWRDWVHTKASIDLAYLEKIEVKLESLNKEIASDDRLGAQFQVGHSYVTPAFDSDIKDAANWFSQVVETEIFPLLEEYWFDDPKKTLSQKTALLNDL